MLPTTEGSKLRRVRTHYSISFNWRIDFTSLTNGSWYRIVYVYSAVVGVRQIAHRARSFVICVRVKYELELRKGIMCETPAVSYKTACLRYVEDDVRNIVHMACVDNDDGRDAVEC